MGLIRPGYYQAERFVNAVTIHAVGPSRQVLDYSTGHVEAAITNAGHWTLRDEIVLCDVVPGPPSGPVEGLEARLWPVAGRHRARHPYYTVVVAPRKRIRNAFGSRDGWFCTRIGLNAQKYRAESDFPIHILAVTDASRQGWECAWALSGYVAPRRSRPFGCDSTAGVGLHGALIGPDWPVWALRFPLPMPM
jgi:hypothetical protein